MHAERDLDVVAKNDRSARVARDDSRRVGRDAVDDIGRDARLTVRGDSRREVMGDATTSVRGNGVTTVGGDHQLSVGGSRVLRVNGSSHSSVTGNYLVEHAGDEVRRTSGHSMTVVGAPEANTSYALHVEGTSTLFSTGPLELSSEREIVLRVGETCLRLGPDRIDLVGASIGVAGGSTRLDASNDGASLVSPGVFSAKANELLVSTSGASMRLKDEVRLDGKRILLNAPDRAREPARLTPPTRFELRDQDGAPIAGARYLLTLEDGGEQTGVLGEDGAVDLVLPNSGFISFPDLLEVKPA
ncbi:MAG: hypothetical protein IPG04_12635 [Polyangiaceae bacterium]|nr:hypothetical protein [Polyangiaceae bacterium]